MRILLLADIHGNWPALEAVLRAAPPFDRVYFLGDAVGYYPDGDRVLDRLQALKAQAVLGNHDAWLLGFGEGSLEGGLQGLLAWQRARLTPRQLAYLASWPWTREEAGALLVHGSPSHPWVYVDSLEAAWEAFLSTQAPLVFHGHTHLAGAFTLEGSRVRWVAFPRGGTLRLEKGLRALINPGSVGQPRDGVPGAAFALWEGAEVRFFRVSYDLGAVRARVEEVGFPRWLWTRLYGGR